MTQKKHITSTSVLRTRPEAAVWQEDKGMAEDEMVECHHRHNGHEFEWVPGVGDV